MKAVCLAVALLVVAGVTVQADGATHFLPQRSSLTPVLEGFWQSCPDSDDSGYGERAMVWREHGKAIAEIHLGPRDGFALFTGEVDGDRDHASPDNLLGPAYHYNDVPTVAGGRNWTALGLHLNVVRVDGSYTDCYSYFVKAEAFARGKVAE